LFKNFCERARHTVVNEYVVRLRVKQDTDASARVRQMMKSAIWSALFSFSPCFQMSHGSRDVRLHFNRVFAPVSETVLQSAVKKRT
jgi:hypothetical protein